MVDFHKDFYIPEIQKISVHLPHVRILGTHHCGNPYQEAFKHRSDFQDVLCFVIINNVQYPDFYTKSNLNTMVIIGLCILKTSLCNTSVPQINKHPNLLHTFAHVIMCFNRLCVITANNMHLRQLHTEKNH